MFKVIKMIFDNEENAIYIVRRPNNIYFYFAESFYERYNPQDCTIMDIKLDNYPIDEQDFIMSFWWAELGLPVRMKIFDIIWSEF